MLLLNNAKYCFDTRTRGLIETDVGGMHDRAGMQRCGGVTTVEYAWSSRHAEVWRSNHSRVCMVKQACRGVAE